MKVYRIYINGWELFQPQLDYVHLCISNYDALLNFSFKYSESCYQVGMDLTTIAKIQTGHMTGICCHYLDILFQTQKNITQIKLGVENSYIDAISQSETDFNT